MNLRLIFFALLTLIGSSIQAQWTPQASGLSAGRFVQFLDAVDTNVVWGLAADPANQSTPVQQFTKTNDGGSIWIANPINNAAGLSPSGIFALNADTAWVAMFNGTAGGGKILKTTDGGINWVHQNTALFAAPDGFPNIVYFFDASDGICMGDPTAGYFEIYTTTDGGTNWIRTPQVNIAAQLSGEFGITSVYTANGDSTIWFGTNLGRIYKSTNRGLNWTVASTPYTGSYIGDIAFRDDMNGIASNGSLGALADMIRTTDGGNTWTLVSVNTANIPNKVLSYVPGTDSTYFLSSPQLGGGTAFTLDDANSWVPVDNLIHSDIEFVNATTGWTGSNELNAPMFKWSGPVQQNCISLLGPLEFTSPDSVCALDPVDYSIHIDLSGDPAQHIGFNAVFYDENFNLIGNQSVQDLVAAGFPNQFIPDAGQTDIGTFQFTVFFNLAANSEIVHFGIQVFPTQCSDDTSNTIINSVFQDVTNCAVANVSGCSVNLSLGNCPQTGLVTYNVSYTINGGPPTPGSTANYTGPAGMVTVVFTVDNGVCLRDITQTFNCTGVGISEHANEGFRLYPNPANDKIIVKADPSVQISKIVIRDVLGRIQYANLHSLTDPSEISIDINSLSQGTYFIEITSDGVDSTHQLKFIKI